MVVVDPYFPRPLLLPPVLPSTPPPPMKPALFLDNVPPPQTLLTFTTFVDLLLCRCWLPPVDLQNFLFLGQLLQS